MTDIVSCMCCHCKRIIPLSDLTIFEGRDYHDSCYLKTVRTRISELDKKVQRGTATILDAKELGELHEIQESVKKDMEDPPGDFGHIPDKPIFFGQSPLGLHSAYNIPRWKKLLREKGSLMGTKYHLHKKPELSLPQTEPIFKIITDESGHKSCIQIGSKEINNNPSLPLEKNKIILSVPEKSNQVDMNQ